MMLPSLAFSGSKVVVVYYEAWSVIHGQIIRNQAKGPYLNAMQANLAALHIARSFRMVRRAHACAEIDCNRDLHLEGKLEQLQIHPVARHKISVAPELLPAMSERTHALPLRVPSVDILRIECKVELEGIERQVALGTIQDERLEFEESGAKRASTVELDIDEPVHVARYT